MFEFHTPGLHNVYAADGSTFKAFLSLHPVLRSVRLALDPLHRPPYSNNIIYHSNNGVGVGGWGEGRAAVLTVHLSYTLRHMLIWSRFTRVYVPLWTCGLRQLLTLTPSRHRPSQLPPSITCTVHFCPCTVFPARLFSEESYSPWNRRCVSLTSSPLWWGARAGHVTDGDYDEQWSLKLGLYWLFLTRGFYVLVSFWHFCAAPTDCLFF